MGKLICEICGGSLMMNIDNIAECESCGMKYSKEKVAQMVKIDGAVEITKGEAEKERLLKNAETFLELGDVKKSENLYEQITNEYPDDYRGWMGRFKIPLLYLVPSVCNLVKCQDYEEKISKLGYSKLTDELWDGFFKNRIKHDFQIIEKSHSEYSNTCSIIDNFSAELLCFNTKLLNNRLSELQQEIGEKYVRKFLNGDVLSFPYDEINDSKYNYLWNVYTNCFHSEEKIQCSKVLSPLFSMGKLNAKRLQNLSSNERVNFINSLGVENFEQIDSVYFLLGKTIVYRSNYGEHTYIKEINKVITERNLGILLEKNGISSKYFMLTKEQCIDTIINKFNKASDKIKIFQDFHFGVDDYAFTKQIVSVEEFYFDIPHTPTSLPDPYCIFAKGTILHGGKYIIDDKVGVLNADEVYALLEKADSYFNNIEIEKLKKSYRVNGLCQHCGGSFTGFFKKKCSKCGKEKDY